MNWMRLSAFCFALGHCISQEYVFSGGFTGGEFQEFSTKSGEILRWTSSDLARRLSGPELEEFSRVISQFPGLEVDLVRYINIIKEVENHPEELLQLPNRFGRMESSPAHYVKNPATGACYIYVTKSFHENINQGLLGL